MNEKLNVNGIAIKAGISRNKIRYTPEVLNKFSLTLTGRPILKDHNTTVDNTVGLVTQSFSLNKGETVQYSGWVKDLDVQEKIKDGRIKEVSIGAIAGKVLKESDDSDILLVEDLEGMELSLTPTPGVMGTSVVHAIERFNKGEKMKPILEVIGDWIKNDKVLSEKIDNIHKEEKMFKCPECDEEMPMAEKEEHMAGHKEEEKKNIEVENMENEKLKLKENELKVMSEELKILKENERQRVINEYKQVAKERKVKERNLEGVSLEVIKMLTDELKSIDVDLTQGRVNNLQNNAVAQITETHKYGGTAYMVEDSGLFIERSLDGNKWAMSFDPMKIKAEGVRWRLAKNSLPTLY